MAQSEHTAQREDTTPVRGVHMVFIQQYLYGLLFFGIMGFLFGSIREFREIKPVHKTQKLTKEQWTITLQQGGRVFRRMAFWWTVMFLLVVLTSQFEG